MSVKPEAFAGTLEWSRLQQQKIGLVDMQYARFLPSNKRLLRNYGPGHPPERDEPSIDATSSRHVIENSMQFATIQHQFNEMASNHANHTHAAR